MTQLPIEGYGLPADCWPQVHVSIYRGERSFNQIMWRQHIKPPAIVGILDHDYHCKSVATQIPLDVGFAPISYTGQKFLPTKDQTSIASCSVNSKLRALNHVNFYTTQAICLELVKSCFLLNHGEIVKFH